jgi:hypothetical protein
MINDIWEYWDVDAWGTDTWGESSAADPNVIRITCVYQPTLTIIGRFEG